MNSFFGKVIGLTKDEILENREYTKTIIKSKEINSNELSKIKYENYLKHFDELVTIRKEYWINNVNCNKKLILKEFEFLLHRFYLFNDNGIMRYLISSSIELIFKTLSTFNHNETISFIYNENNFHVIINSIRLSYNNNNAHLIYRWFDNPTWVEKNTEEKTLYLGEDNVEKLIKLFRKYE